MKKLYIFTPLIFVLMIMSSCQILTNKNNLKNDPKNEVQTNPNSKKEQLEVRFSCGEDEISQYTNEGWIIVKEYSEEKICTWKSFPATRDCDMDLDKGCKVTKPDKIGEEKIYLLER